jgi:hypothetical protein
MTDDPTPIWRRGLWFDGNNDYQTVTGMTLHHSFTLRTWIKVYDAGTVFSINRTSPTGGNGKADYFVFSVGTNYVTLVFNGEFKSDTTVDATNTKDLSDNWHQVAVCVVYDTTNDNSTVQLRIDNANVNLS